MDGSRGKTNGEREAFQQRAFLPPPQPQMQSWPQLRGDHVDLQTLESRFGRLSVIDSSVVHRNNQGINGGGGGYLVSQNNNYAHREIADSHLQNGYHVNGGQTSTSGNSRDDVVPYFSRNNLIPYGSGINNIWVSLAKDRISSLELQKTISVGSRETIDTIFNHLIPHTCDLMVDPFGHQVFDQLMKKCTSQQINHILGILTHHHSRFLRICTDPLGANAIQSLLKCLQSEDQISRILQVISISTLTLTKNYDAKNVIVLCFALFSPSLNRGLLEVIAGNCYQIATDQHGCFMLQQCLNLCCEELKKRLLIEIISNALKLCVDCYGNYVVQYVILHFSLYKHVREELVRYLKGSFGYLSRNKYASHVVQRLLGFKDMSSRSIVCELLNEIDTLVLDPFGNYVIQTAWSVSQDDIRNILMWRIRRNEGFIRCNKFGRKVLEKLNLRIW